jgi:tetratricopeptide (TPR) repeat protein
LAPLAPGGRGVGGEGALNEQPPDDADRAAAPPPAADSDDSLPAPHDEQYNIYLRAGLIEYLQEHKAAALTFFEKAKPFEPKRNFVVVQGEIPTGIEQLIALAKSDGWLTPELVRKGDDRARLILMLADIYYKAERFPKAIDLCNKLVDGIAPKATREQQSWARFKRARNIYCLTGDAKDPNAALRDYAAAVQIAPRTDWAPEAIFLAANLHWNCFQDADAAIALWRQLIRDYPQSRETPRAAYFIGVAYEWSRRPNEARAVFQAFLQKYRDSRFAQAAREDLDELDDRAKQAAGQNKPGRH